MKLSTIERFVEKLPIKELKKLKVKVDYLIYKNQTPVSYETELLFNALKLVVEKETKTTIKPIYFLIKKDKNLETKLNETVTFLLTFVENCGMLNLKKSEMVKLFNTYSEITAKFILTNTEMPLTIRTILSLHEHFPALLNKSFPGYAQANLISWIMG